MRRILCAILTGTLLLTALSGCTGREQPPEPVQESPSAPESLSAEGPFYETVLRELGAGDTDDGRLIATPCSLLTADWAKPEELDRFFEEVFASVRLPVSVKTRLGIREAEEFPRLLEIFNRYPIKTLTIHPRVQKEFYKGPIHRDVFAAAAVGSRNPVCYNGDLLTVEDCRAFEQEFPQADAVMIGRAVVADPALLRKIRGGAPATREEIQRFTAELYREYQDFYGQVGTAAQRMKEVWFYLIHLFEGGERIDKKMRRSRSPGEYEALEAQIFAELPLRDHAEGPLI